MCGFSVFQPTLSLDYSSLPSSLSTSCTSPGQPWQTTQVRDHSLRHVPHLVSHDKQPRYVITLYVMYLTWSAMTNNPGTWSLSTSCTSPGRPWQTTQVRDHSLRHVPHLVGHDKQPRYVITLYVMYLAWSAMTNNPGTWSLSTSCTSPGRPWQTTQVCDHSLRHVPHLVSHDKQPRYVITLYVMYLTWSAMTNNPGTWSLSTSCTSPGQPWQTTQVRDHSLRHVPHLVGHDKQPRYVITLYVMYLTWSAMTNNPGTWSLSTSCTSLGRPWQTTQVRDHSLRHVPHLVGHDKQHRYA